MLESRHERIGEAQAILGRLIAFPTISSDSNLDLIAHAAALLDDAGAKVRVWQSADEPKANLFASFGPERQGGIVLSGHSDVVPVTGQHWTSDPFAMRVEDGRLYGRGSCDMKGFIACVLAMAPAFGAASLARPLHVALTHDEETGCMGGRRLVEDLGKAGIHPSVSIIGEPTSMRIIEGHKGCYEYTTRFRGLAAHGSLTHKGVNAIEYAARYITRLMELREELANPQPSALRFDPPVTTLQVGRIEGGVSRNTIAPDCSVEWEMRPVRTEDAEFIKMQIARYAEEELLPQMRERFADAAIETEVIGEIAGLVPTSENEARDICAALTGSRESDVVSFGTEAGLFQERGISTVVCGPGSIEQAHKPDEFIEIAELGRCLTMLEKLLAQVSART